MSFHRDVLEGIQAFTSMTQALKGDARDDYYKWKLESDPSYQAAQAQQEAADRIRAEGGTPPPGSPGPRTFWDRLSGRPIGTRTAINTTSQPTSMGTGGGMTDQGSWAPNARPAQDQSGGILNFGDSVSRWNKGGRVKRFQEGGEVDDDLVRTLPAPPDEAQPIQPPLPTDRMATEAVRTQPMPTQTPPELSPREQRMKDLQEQARTEVRANTMAAGTTAAETASPYAEEKSSSKVGRAVRSALGTPEERALQKEIWDLHAEKNEISPGWFTSTTKSERANIRNRQAEIDAEIVKKTEQLNKLRGSDEGEEDLRAPGPTSPQVPPVAVNTNAMRVAGAQPRPVTPVVTPAQGSNEGVVPPGQLPPYERDPRLGVPVPRTGPAEAGPGPTVTAGQTPTGSGQPTPGGVPQQAAPPQGGGPGTGRTESADTRTRAFDPTMDRIDPNTGRTMPAQLDAQGRPVMQGPPPQLAAQHEENLNRALSGAAHFGQWIAGGSTGGQAALRQHVGAMPADIANGVYQAWSGGGRLNPAEAMTRYMVYQYEALSSRGLSAQANQMAFEVVQRLGMESAKYADQAVQMVRNGDLGGATNMLMKAHMFTPDNRHLALSKDGRQLIVLNDTSQQPVTQPFNVTPQFILAAAMGLRDGSGMWQHLLSRAQMHVSTMKGADKDAEGRAIRNRNNLLRGQLLEQKLRGGGKGGGGAASSDVARFNRLTMGGKDTGGGSTTIIKQGSDDDGLMRDDTGGSSEED